MISKLLSFEPSQPKAVLMHNELYERMIGGFNKINANKIVTPIKVRYPLSSNAKDINEIAHLISQ